MLNSIGTAAVIGSGVMGTAIAAQLAGAGIRTLLLDIVPSDVGPGATPAERNRLPREALARALKMKPAPFYSPGVAGLIEVGNLDDDLARAGGCDFVIEAIVENLEIKQQLFRRLAPHLAGHTLLASNTSGLSIANMSQALPDSVQQRFAVLHFFNPVRYMHLVEVSGGPRTTEQTLQKLSGLAQFLGKGVVYTRDTTNFVANRVGVHAMMYTMAAMGRHGLGVEAVDAIVAKPMARSAGAVFKTADMVGLDTLVHVANNCFDTLVDDEQRELFKVPEVVTRLVDNGQLGRKSGAGFYKKAKADVLVLDLASWQYQPKQKLRFESVGAVRNIEDPGARLKALVSAQDAAARFAWDVLAHSLLYAAARVGEIAEDVVSIDRAMRWGFNWELGPFEAWDAIGVQASVARMQEEGMPVPAWVQKLAEAGGSFYAGDAAQPTYLDRETAKHRPVPQDPREIRLEALKSDPARIVKKNFGASLVDLGDGALCVEVHTKMNTIDADVIALLQEGIAEAEKNFEALVVANDGAHFGAGANLFMIFAAAQSKKWDQIESVINGLQQALQGLRHARVPVVAAPFQYTLGGGAELAMAADACQAHAETYMGLVEVGVGLIPAGGGCLRMLERYTRPLGSIEGADLLPAVGQASLNIAMAKVATSAEEAVSLRYLRPSDGISLSRPHLLRAAKQRALGMSADYRPPRPQRLKVAGRDAAATIGARIWAMVEGGYASEYDGHLAKQVAHVLCGGNALPGAELTEQAVLDLEREAFLSLCGQPLTLARIEHMLKRNKPLRN